MLARLRQAAAALVLVAVAVIAGPGVAHAALGGPVDCTPNDPSPYCIVVVTDPGAPGQGGGTTTVTCHEPGTSTVWPCYVPGAGWLMSDACYWRPMTATEVAEFPLLFPAPIPPGRWYEGECGDPTIPDWVLTKNQVFAAAPEASLLAAEAEALLRLPTPVVQLNPPAGQMELVRVPVWMWLGASSYTATSATVRVPGLAVTATATPTQVLWSTGDGSTVICHGPGTPWTTGTNPAAASPSCGHTYTRSSATQPGHTFTVTATVTWQITWRGGAGGGRAPDLTTRTSVQVAVGQAETVITH